MYKYFIVRSFARWLIRLYLYARLKTGRFIRKPETRFGHCSELSKMDELSYFLTEVISIMIYSLAHKNQSQGHDTELIVKKKR